MTMNLKIPKYSFLKSNYFVFFTKPRPEGEHSGYLYPVCSVWGFSVCTVILLAATPFQ